MTDSLPGADSMGQLKHFSSVRGSLSLLRGHYEQLCNTEALRRLGVPSLRNLRIQDLPILRDWALMATPIQISYPDMTMEMINLVLEQGLKQRMV